MTDVRYLKSTLAGLSAALVLGCSATGPHYNNFVESGRSLDRSLARVVFYKEEKKDLFGIASTAVFSVNGVQKGIVSWGGFNLIDLPPGTTKIAVSQQGGLGSCNVGINLMENSTYFIKIDQRLEQAGAVFFFGLIGALVETQVSDCSGAYKMSLVEEGLALDQLRNLRLTK